MSEGLGSYPVGLLDSSGHLKRFLADTSFEPYRREAFRHRSIPAGRESVEITNIPGEGTVNTEGLWRREQTDWSQGAGQMYLDHKKTSQDNRFNYSKGIDVFTLPYQATLLPDTYQAVAENGTDLLMSRCGDWIVTAAGGAVKYYQGASWPSTFSLYGTCGAGTTYGGSAWTVVYSICTNDSYCYIGTDTGIWFCNIGESGGSYITGPYTFELYAAPDTSTGYTGGYQMVRWANDQLVASFNNRLYAFQPRSATGFPTFGVSPSDGNADTNIMQGEQVSGIVTVGTVTPHGLGEGESFSITNSQVEIDITAATISGSVMTLTSSADHGLMIGDQIEITLFFNGVPNGRTENVSVRAVPTATTFTYVPKKYGAAAVNTGFVAGLVIGSITGNYNASWVVNSVVSDVVFEFLAADTYGPSFLGGQISANAPSDILFTHSNPNYVWSDAASGETEIYFGGYVQSSSGAKYSGCVYRSDLLGSSTTTETGTTVISNSTVAQPWALDTPVQCLPMSPDEFPLCIEAYLNYIFIGTNRGVRMCQTLSIYDPTATATGDLKAGPLIPNLIGATITNNIGVTAIVGDGRYVWFAWSNYDGQTSGLGKMNLQTFIDGDPLSPAYASDVMCDTTNNITCLDWNPRTQSPLIAVDGVGIYAVCASNVGGALSVDKYVASGFITSGIFDYGISDPKIPIFFDYGMASIGTPPYATSVQALVVFDPQTGQGEYATIDEFVSGGEQTEFPLPVPYGRGTQFSVTMTLTSDTDGFYTPNLYRWTLRSWPAVVAGTNIMMVVQSFDVNIADGGEKFDDPYEAFIWFENKRQTQEVLTYIEGPLRVMGVITLSDWLPHKMRDTYEGGYQGDQVLTFQTLGLYEYVKAETS